LSSLLLVGSVFILAVVAYFSLRKDALSQYDLPLGQRFVSTDPSVVEQSQKALRRIKAKVRAATGRGAALSGKKRIDHMRNVMDSFFAHVEVKSKIISTTAGTVPAEWIIAPNVDTSHRLLYIHGGAFFAGSPRSHRVITSKLSEIGNCAVLAIDYRLTPEYTRLDCLKDCQDGYVWMLNNGPEGGSQAANAYVAGDSAGGNLALCLTAWIRDTEKRVPNAVVALSPITDSRLASPSIKTNLESDVILKSLAKQLSWVPSMFISLVARRLAKHDTKDPRISPLLGDLSGLPPILVQASDSEILRDDGRRYVNKAVAAGSNAVLQLWANMPHVWQIFDPELPEASEAFEEIRLFLERHT
jgi:acetyl esterase/lipase